MRVHLAGVLHDYTGGAGEVNLPAESLAGVLDELDRRYPGLRFRIIDEQNRVRPHLRVFVNTAVVREISHPLGPEDEVWILPALSGGAP